MSASAKVTVIPDVARVQLGVTVTKPTVKAVRDVGAKAHDRDHRRDQGARCRRRRHPDDQPQPLPQYGNGSTPRIVGYQISEQIQVTVRDLDKAGDVVDTATAKGATDVNGISFELADPVKAQNDARAAAVAAAKVSAQAMAAAGNVSLGAVVPITDASPPSPDLFTVMALRAMPPWRHRSSQERRTECDGDGRLRDQLDLGAVRQRATLHDIGCRVDFRCRRFAAARTVRFAAACFAPWL